MASGLGSAGGAYVETYLWIDQRFLGCCDVVDHQLSIKRRTALD
jgi:hypothetical protein